MKALFGILLAGTVGCASAQLASPANAATLNEKVLYSFCNQTNCADGFDPMFARVIDTNGTLYGTVGQGAGGAGAVYALDLGTGAETVIHAFCFSCADGDQPETGVIDASGKLYGTTAAGGAHGPGALFSLDPNTDREKVLYSFCSQQNCADGSQPSLGDLINVKGVLYGTTLLGGLTTCPLFLSEGCGVVFSFDRKTGVEKVLYTFCSEQNCTDGAGPEGIISVNETLYGTTLEGGSSGCEGNGCGIVFSVNPNTGAETVLHEFGGGLDGETPNGSLVDVKGILYGTTVDGGSHGSGTVFSIDPTTGAEKVLYSFCSQESCADGAEPNAALVAVKDVLYGTTPLGGRPGRGCFHDGCGTVFSIDPNTGAETVLYTFCSLRSCKDGAVPSASLIAVGDDLYGTTRGGGSHNCGLAYGCGTVFVLSKSY